MVKNDAWIILHNLDNLGAFETKFAQSNLFSQDLSPSRLQRLMTFYEGNCVLGKKKQNFWELLDTGLNCHYLRRLKMSLGSTSQNRSLWRPGDQSSFSLDPCQNGPTGFPIPYCGYFPSSKMHDQNRYSQQLAESSHQLTDLCSEG